MASADYLKDLFGLDGKTAIAIGGTGELGGAFIDALAKAGAHVVISGRGEKAGRTRADELIAEGGSAEFFPVDVTRRESLEALRDHLRSQGRTIDVLINGAGVNSATPFLEITDEEWNKIFNVNLRGIRLACQVFGPVMIEQQSGSIINIASLSGITPLSRVFTYSATKAGVINLTQNLAREWARHGVRVNALSPGFFPAEQNKEILSEERQRQIKSHTPMGRYGEPEELAGAILLMASPNAGSFLTGANIVVDGGFMAMTI
ncbi:MAG: SDR family oxidoreductase [Planctomycetaceae bacterium]